jgi:hypothetical protein
VRVWQRSEISKRLRCGHRHPSKSEVSRKSSMRLFILHLAIFGSCIKRYVSHVSRTL